MQLKQEAISFGYRRVWIRHKAHGGEQDIAGLSSRIDGIAKAIPFKVGLGSCIANDLRHPSSSNTKSALKSQPPSISSSIEPSPSLSSGFYFR